MTAHTGTAMGGATPRRVTVVAPHTRVDVALPLLVTVAELIPQLVALTGLHSDEAGAAGWHLGRLGGEPLDPADSVVSAAIDDGEVLYLTPRGAHLPPAVFDDVVDAVAGDAESRAGIWQTADTVRAGVIAGVIATAGVLGVALTATQSRGLAAAVLAAGTVLALLAGALLTRTGGTARAAVGGTIAAGGVAGAALAGALVVAGDAPVGRFGAAELLGAASAAAFAAGVAAALIRRYTRRFVTLAIVSVVAMLAAGVAVGVGGAKVAAVTAALALGVTSLLPITALRLARLAPAPVPADMESFRANEGPTAVNEVADRAGLAEHMLNSLVTGQTAVLLGSALLVSAAGVAGRSLAAVLGVTLLLRARGPRGRVQRLALLIGGAGAAVAATVATGTATDWKPVSAFAAGAVVVAAIAFAYAVRAPRRQPSPYLARLLDVAEFIGYGSVLPVAVAVLGLYDVVRGIGG